MLRITSIRFAECAVPLKRPVRLGKSEIRTRDYLALRIETEAGIAGEALGYIRGTPLFAALVSVAPRLIGADARMRRAVLRTLDESNIPGRAAFTRATSLLDIALWDIAAKAASVPLFQLLGGLNRTAPATAVAGYGTDVRTIEDIAGEVSRRRDDGYSRVKVMLHGGDCDFDRRLLEAVTSLPVRVAADAHWSWSTLTEALRYCRPLDSVELDFLEDPFSALDLRLSHELQTRIRTPIAAGEDVFGTSQIDHLVRGIGLLRIDATTSGGITGAIEAINVAAAAGRNVLPHVFAPLHVHLACAFPNVEGVEIIPAEADADPLDVLLRRTPAVRDGRIEVDEISGVGLDLDWDAIDRLQWRKHVES